MMGLVWWTDLRWAWTTLGRHSQQLLTVVISSKITGWWCNNHLEKYECVSWEGWHPIYEMENKKCLQPPTSSPCFNNPIPSLPFFCQATVLPVRFTKSMLMGVIRVASSASRGCVANMATRDLHYFSGKPSGNTWKTHVKTLENMENN